MIEAAVLDGDEGARQVGRQVLEGDRRAAHLAAHRQRLAVEPVDLDRGRALGDGQRLDRRQRGCDQRDRAARHDQPPEAEHHAPIDEASQRRARRRIAAGRGFALGALGARLGPALGCALGAPRSRLRIVGIGHLAPPRCPDRHRREGGLRGGYRWTARPGQNLWCHAPRMSVRRNCHIRSFPRTRESRLCQTARTFFGQRLDPRVRGDERVERLVSVTGSSAFADDDGGESSRR
jgi:hypothetical protein